MGRLKGWLCSVADTSLALECFGKNRFGHVFHSTKQDGANRVARLHPSREILLKRIAGRHRQRLERVCTASKEKLEGLCLGKRRL